MRFVRSLKIKLIVALTLALVLIPVWDDKGEAADGKVRVSLRRPENPFLIHVILKASEPPMKHTILDRLRKRKV